MPEQPDCDLHDLRIGSLEREVAALRPLPGEVALLKRDIEHGVASIHALIESRPVALSRAEISEVVEAHAAKAGPSVWRIAAAVGAPGGVVAWILYYAAALVSDPGVTLAPPPAPQAEAPAPVEAQ